MMLSAPATLKSKQRFAATMRVTLFTISQGSNMGQRLGRYITRFRDTYFFPDKRGPQTVFSYKPRPGAEEAIYRLISDITISMKNTEYLQLPELVMNAIEVRLSDQEMAHYQTMKRELVLSLLDREIDAVNAAALSGKLLQMANGAVY